MNNLILAFISATRQSVTQAVLSDKVIFIQHEPMEHLCLTQCLAEADDFKMTLAFGDLINSAGNTMFRNVSGMIHRTDDLVQGNYDQHYWFYLKTPCNKKNCDCTIKPTGEYLISYHHGGYESLSKTYQALLSYANYNRLLLNKYFYEEMVVGDWAATNCNDYILKVSVQII